MNRRTLENLVLATAAERYRAVRREAPPPAFAKQVRAFVRGRLEDPKAYHSCVVRNGEVAEYVQAFRAPPGPLDLAVVHPWLIADDEVETALVRREVAAMRRFLGGRRLHLNAIIFPHQVRLRAALEAAGFGLDSYELVGKVQDGLVAMRRRAREVDASPYQLAPMDLGRDLLQALRLDRLCHAAEPTSRAHGFSPAVQRAEMTSFFEEATQGRNRVLTLRRGRTLVGLVGVTFHPRQPETALLGTITVHPEHQGQGLASLLYREALLAMAEGGARWYQGFTSTDRVLHLAKEMKRRVAHVVLTDGPWAKARPS